MSADYLKLLIIKLRGTTVLESKVQLESKRLSRIGAYPNRGLIDKVMILL